ncbi:MAG: isoprenylcysteine carboxylmethyltransferase family protein [Chloroflexi bacterium]|nr:isoprenylcysteine carboxylmethyltransferase family protein [Chloroflexota bacterium]
MSRPAILFMLVVAPVLAICLARLGLETLGSNILSWFLLVLGVAYPAGGVIYYFIRRQPFWKSAGGGEAAREEKGDRSFWAILPGFLVVFFAPPIEWMYLPAVLPRTLWMQIAGLVLILAAVALRVWTRAHLRGLYSGHVEVQVGHRLVQSGPYCFVRHPGYTGFLLMTLGVAIGYSSLIGLAAIPVLLLPGLAYRMGVEEKLLLAQFGGEYRTYIQKTKRLIPFIW